jgi:hypothetical protein
MSVGPPAPDPHGLQDTVEASRIGRAVISAFVAITIAALVFWNLPDSEIRARALPLVEPYIRATGLDQNWGVFAPDPRRTTNTLLARATYADGRTEDLLLPAGDPFVSAYWDYRWRKWGEWAMSSEYEHLWHPTAVWFSRRAADDGEDPVEVVLMRRWYPLLPPGSGPDRGESQDTPYYTLTVVPPDGESE